MASTGAEGPLSGRELDGRMAGDRGAIDTERADVDDAVLEALELPLNGPRRFWLGFVFVDERRLAVRAHALADELVRGRRLKLDVHTASDAGALDRLAREMVRHEATEEPVWADWSAVGSDKADRAAVECALTLMNAARTRLSKALHGGLVIVAPSWSEQICALGAVDLWSGREFALRLRPTMKRSGTTRDVGVDVGHRLQLWRRFAPTEVMRSLRERGVSAALERVSALNAEADPQDRPRLATVFAGLALDAGDREAATKSVHAVLERGDAPPEVLAAAIEIAAVGSRDPMLATGLWRQAVVAAQERLGADHPDTLASRNNLASAYRSAGDLARAVPLLEATLSDSERVLGSDHPDTLASRNNLAYAYESAGDLARAVPLLEATLSDRERVLGSDHPDTLTSRNNLAAAYESAGDLARAIPLYEATLSDSERVLGPGSAVGGHTAMILRR